MRYHGKCLRTHTVHMRKWFILVVILLLHILLYNKSDRKTIKLPYGMKLLLIISYVQIFHSFVYYPLYSPHILAVFYYYFNLFIYLLLPYIHCTVQFNGCDTCATEIPRVLREFIKIYLFEYILYLYVVVYTNCCQMKNFNEFNNPCAR